jgi:phosphatidylethanolamine-binding protein (PEBP) family uncharacterized protein
MAQRTGAHGLVVLGLAFVVAVISGCGGGSNSSSTVASASPGKASEAPSAKVDEAEKSGPTGSSGQKSKSGGAKAESDQAKVEKPGSDHAHPAKVAGSKAAKKTESAAGEGEEEHQLGKTGYKNKKAEPEPENIPVANMTIFSPEVPGSTALPAKFTCKGKDVWPALSWNAPPAGTQELVLFAMNIQPVKGKLFFDWAVAGIDPAESGVASGQLPGGAVLGETSRGGTKYSICPEGGEETFIFQLFALPEKVGAKQGFDPLEMRAKALEVAPNAGIFSVYSG